eukprot:m.299758 g.299758  ORF g.299758 m.299758 type:complete len:76 (+) comp15873_c2_seq1:2054-2281(+)
MVLSDKALCSSNQTLHVQVPLHINLAVRFVVTAAVAVAVTLLDLLPEVVAVYGWACSDATDKTPAHLLWQYSLHL